jgi:hypothetical protein
VDDPDDLPVETWYAISDAVGADQASYHVERTRAGHALANPPQGFRTTLTRAGVTLQVAGLAWEMSLRAWGYGETLAAVSAVEPTGGANRVTYEREGLTEWYVNGPFGLQQGFTVRQPSDGRCRPGSA